MATKREQANTVLLEYIKNNTPKKGANKGITPTWADLLDFVAEIVMNFSVQCDMALVKSGEKKTVEEVINDVYLRTGQILIERIEELREKGIIINPVDEEEGEEEEEPTIDPTRPIDVDYEVVDDE